MPPIRSVAGMRDLLPDQSETWAHALGLAEANAWVRGYASIVTPVLEHTEVFLHGVGEGTDIVDKEMYTFLDRGGDSLTLRPEATASVMRAYFEGGLQQGPQPARLWYEGPMFRGERPQKGRYREFRQFGVEAIGDGSSGFDVEVIELAHDWLADCGLAATLQLNSIGDAVCRPGYREALRDYYRPHLDELCDDDRRRFEVNPLRMLDCKKPTCTPFQAGAPSPIDHLCDPCREHHDGVKAGLTALEVEYVENPRLVRGLDYYTRTAFEFWDPGHRGAQNAYGGGGRYDGLAETLGFAPTPAVGFAMGLDRVVLGIIDAGLAEPPARPEVAVIPAADGATAVALRLARELRAMPLVTVVDLSNRSLKARMRQAQKQEAQVVVIIGEQELADGTAAVKDMSNGEQVLVQASAVAGAVAAIVARGEGSA